MILLLLACSMRPEPTLLSGDTLPGPAGPPTPSSMQLAVSDISPGVDATLVVNGATPGEIVLFGGSTRGQGSGPCAAALSGSCLGIRRPVLLGQAVADPDGIATLHRAANGVSPGLDLCVQAATGTGAVSEIECRQVQVAPTVDGVCPAQGTCPGLCDQGSCLLTWGTGAWPVMTWAGDRLLALHQLNERYAYPQPGGYESGDSGLPPSTANEGRLVEIDPERGVYRVLRTFDRDIDWVESGETLVTVGRQVFHNTVVGRTSPSQTGQWEAHRVDRDTKAVHALAGMGEGLHVYQGQVWSSGAVYDPTTDTVTAVPWSTGALRFRIDGGAVRNNRDRWRARVSLSLQEEGTGDVLWSDVRRRTLSVPSRLHGSGIVETYHYLRGALNVYQIDRVQPLTGQRQLLHAFDRGDDVMATAIEGDHFFTLVEHGVLDPIEIGMLDLSTDTFGTVGSMEGDPFLRGPFAGPGGYATGLAASPSHLYVGMNGRLWQRPR